MNYQDNDTLNASQQNASRQNTNQPKAEKSKNKEAMVAKLLAGVASGMAVGAGASYAAVQMGETAEPVPENTTAQEEATTHHTDEQKIEKRVEVLEEKERIREQQDAERQQQERPQLEHDEQNEAMNEVDFIKNHDVKIDKIEETEYEGNTVNFYHGTVDDHEAMFMDDGNDHVIAAVVDFNDNGTPDTNEYIDLSDNQLSAQQLEACQVTPPDNEVEVLAVENDIDINGHSVDAAFVSINDEPVIFVDTDHDSEVNLAIADYNGDGDITYEENLDVSEAHITMPTQDDIADVMTAGADDCSNADVEVYDI